MSLFPLQSSSLTKYYYQYYLVMNYHHHYFVAHTLDSLLMNDGMKYFTRRYAALDQELEKERNHAIA